MSIFQRLFRIFQSEAHSAVDKFEDPIKLTEQGIRDLKNDLQESMASLAQVKAIAIRQRKDAEDQKKLAGDYERKAMLLLQQGQRGEVVPTEADRLATAALEKKEEAVQRATTLSNDFTKQEQLANQLESKVKKLKNKIGHYEAELTTLRARAKTADSMEKINRQLSNVDTSGTIAMLEKMKEKVTEQEALAEAYGDMADGATSIDEEIDKAIGSPTAVKAQDSLTELKKRMGLPAGEPADGGAGASGGTAAASGGTADGDGAA